MLLSTSRLDLDHGVPVELALAEALSVSPSLSLNPFTLTPSYIFSPSLTRPIALSCGEVKPTFALRDEALRT